MFQVQALYNLPSLMGPADPADPAAAPGIQFSISALEIQLRAPLNLPNFGGQQYDVCFIRLLKFEEICQLVLMLLNTYLVNVKTKWEISSNFAAFF